MHAPAVLTFTAASLALPAAAATIDFGDLESGKVLRDLGRGGSVSAVNASPGTPGVAIAYDFDAHPELSYGGQQAPFLGGGNVDPGEDLGSGIAIQGPDPAKILEFRRPAGHLTFRFDAPIASFGFVVVDVEGPEEFATDTGHFVSFASRGEEVLRVDFAEFLAEGSGVYDPTIAFGNNSANRIAPIEASLAGVNSFDTVTIALGGSAVVDELVTQAASIPTPAAAGAGIAGLLALASRRRRG